MASAHSRKLAAAIAVSAEALVSVNRQKQRENTKCGPRRNIFYEGLQIYGNKKFIKI
jgi:hypothetical protein